MLRQAARCPGAGCPPMRRRLCTPAGRHPESAGPRPAIHGSCTARCSLRQPVLTQHQPLTALGRLGSEGDSARLHAQEVGLVVTNLTDECSTRSGHRHSQGPPEATRVQIPAERMSVPEAVGRTSYQGVAMLLLSRCPRSSHELRAPQAYSPQGCLDKKEHAGTCEVMKRVWTLTTACKQNKGC